MPFSARQGTSHNHNPDTSAFGTAEWGFTSSSAFWGTGVFADGADLGLGVAFRVLGTHRLEARAAVQNGRGMGALKTIGALQEAVLRRSLRRHDHDVDQSLWTILQEDWIGARAACRSRLVH